MTSTPTVYTGGTFDLFHTGHLNLLRACRRIAGTHGNVTVALNQDDFVAQYKGAPPVMSYTDRAEILRACRYVDYVIPNTGGPDSRTTIEACRTNFIVIGSDWAQKDYYAQMGFDQSWLDQREIQLIYVPYTPGISSTMLRSANEI